ncbi:hypothetical protein LH384_34550, partial [Pseudomonas aeruginosa]|nr:hypothetical protein [Pseudomonas aeruginosa]
AGMCAGFAVSFIMKVITTSQGITVPIYCDVYFVGTLANIGAMMIANRLTKVTPEEKEQREEGSD